MKQADEFIMVYCPFPMKEDAQRLGHQLVEEKLIACANIIEKVPSIYPWDGQVEQAAEVIMLMKTRKKCLNQVEERLTKAHPSEIPAIVSIAIEESNESYLSWLLSHTKV